MDVFLLYLLMQANTISAFLTIFSTLGLVFLGFWAGISRSENWESKNVPIKLLKFVWIPLTVLAVLFPSTKTIAVMVGGHYAISTVQSETGKKILGLIEQSIEDALKPKK